MIGAPAPAFDRTSIPPSPAHPISPLIHAALLSVANTQAVQLGDLPSLLEYVSLLASTGREHEALKLLGDARPAPPAQQQQGSVLLAASALAPAKLLLQLGELQAARQLLVDELPPQQQLAGSEVASGAGKVG